jgi:hypothetical protein
MSGVLTPAPNFQLEIHVDQQHIHDGEAFDTSSPSANLLNRRATTSSSLCSSPVSIHLHPSMLKGLTFLLTHLSHENRSNREEEHRLAFSNHMLYQNEQYRAGNECVTNQLLSGSSEVL